MSADGWISMEEQMPEPRQLVDVWFCAGTFGWRIADCWWTGARWVCLAPDLATIQGRATHWRVAAPRPATGASIPLETRLA